MNEWPVSGHIGCSSEQKQLGIRGEYTDLRIEVLLQTARDWRGLSQRTDPGGLVLRSQSSQFPKRQRAAAGFAYHALGDVIWYGATCRSAEKVGCSVVG